MASTDDLILFAQVVEAGSFSKVAEQNSLTNSVVSKRIGRLEEELGVQLLYRTTRRLTLSEAGKALYQGAKNVKAAALDAFDAVAGFGEKVSGHVRMSVPTISGELLLADAVADFCQQHPGLTVEMSLDNRFVNLVEEGFDLVIRTGYLDDSSLIARHILDSQWVICAAPAYVRRFGAPREPSDLLTHNCLRYAYQSTGASEWAFKGEEGNYLVSVSGSFSTDNAGALRKAALGARHRLCATLSGLSRSDERRAGGSLPRSGGQEARHLRRLPLHPPAAAQDKAAHRAHPPALSGDWPLLHLRPLSGLRGRMTPPDGRETPGTGG